MINAIRKNIHVDANNIEDIFKKDIHQVNDLERITKIEEQLEKTNKLLMIRTKELMDIQNSIFGKTRAFIGTIRSKIRKPQLLLQDFVVGIKSILFPNKNPLVSVVIPVYDRTIQLMESIESILEQTYQNIEIIIVTDGSPEKTINVVDSYAGNPKVKIFKYFNNTGNAVRGRNKGIREAQGKFISFQDSDDIAEKDRIANSIKFLNKYRVDVVYGGWRAILDGTREINNIKDGQEIMSPDCDIEMMKEMCVPCQSTVTAKRSALLDVGGLNTKLEYKEDHELWLRLMKNGYKFKAIPKVLTNLRLHKGNNELNFKDDEKNWQEKMLSTYNQKPEIKPKIAYIVPDVGISGGVGVVLQHANRLQNKGFDVLLINQNGYSENIQWFENKVPIISYPTAKKYHLKNIDILISTGWQTVGLMKKLQSKRKIYFVQSDERRFYQDEEMIKLIEETYRTNCEYMTEAIWIQKWLNTEFGHNAYYVPNGLDSKIFHKTEPLKKRGSKVRILIEGPIDIWFKGVKEAYEAIKDLDAEIWIVSSLGKPPKDWEYDYFFYRVPMYLMRYIYSSCDIFIKLSKVEGFFGPPLESMICGCSVIVGEVTGHDEYIKNEKNALVVDPYDIESTKKAAQRLIQDTKMRERLITNGYKTAKEWTWERSISYLKRAISKDPVENYCNEKYPEEYNFKKEAKKLGIIE